MIKISNEAKIGVFFVLCLAVLLYLTISTGKLHIRDTGYNIYVTFSEVSGLEKNSPVLFNGLDVGRVQGTEVQYSEEGTKIILKLLVDDNIKIGVNPDVSIKTLGIMGEKYVHISSYNTENYLKPGARVAGKEPSDMDALFTEAEILAKNISELAVNINQAVLDNKQSISVFMTNAKQISDKVNTTLQNNGESVDKIVKNLELASKNFEEFSEDIKHHPWKLLIKTKDKDKDKDKKKSRKRRDNRDRDRW